MTTACTAGEDVESSSIHIWESLQQKAIATLSHVDIDLEFLAPIVRITP